MIQIYPENKIELNDSKAIKFYLKGINFIFEKISD